MKKIYCLMTGLLIAAMHPLFAQNFEEVQKLTFSDGSPRIGAAIDIKRNVAIIGTLGDIVVGGAYIYEKDMNSQWVRKQKLPIVEASPASLIVKAVAISESESLAAVLLNNLTIHLFSRGSSGWENLRKVPLPAYSNYPSLTFSGERLIVSTDRGAVIVESNANYGLYPSGNPHFIYSAAVSGDQAILGAYEKGSDGDHGVAYIFEKVNGRWNEVVRLTPSIEYLGNSFGRSVDISGNTAVVGAYWDKDIVDNTGAVYVFEKTSAGWKESAKLLASDRKTGDLFGYSVAISGSKAVVGARDTQDGGAAYLFEKASSGWKESDRLSPPNGDIFRQFGTSVSIYEDQFIVSAPGDTERGPLAGAAFIYAKNTPTTQTSIARFSLINAKTDKPIPGYEDLQDEAVIDLSKTGLSGADKYNQLNIDVSTDPVKVGSVRLELSGTVSASTTQNIPPYPIFNDKDGDYFSGSLPVGSYTLTAIPYSENRLNGVKGEGKTIHFSVVDTGIPVSADNSFEQTWKLTASDGRANAAFGNPISVFGNYAIVGAPEDNKNGAYTGGAYVYEKTASGWKEVQRLDASVKPEFEPTFGKSVSVDGDRMLIGADTERRLDSNGDTVDFVGATYVYEKTTSGWSEMAKLRPSASDGGGLSLFGRSVALSGNYALIGAFARNAVYFFEETSSGWKQVNKFVNYTDFYEDNFGLSVALSGNYAIVGNPGNSSKGSGTGAAFLYQRTDAGWEEVQRLFPSDPKISAAFGSSVAITDRYAVVGTHDRRNDRPGEVYIYEKTANNWIEVGKFTASDAKANDRFGFSVKAHNNQIMVGAPGNAAAYVFEKTADGWQEKGKMSVSGVGFGHSVFVTDEEYFVGAIGDDEKASNAGAAYIFTEAEVETTLPLSLTRISLVNADTNEDVLELTDGVEVDLSAINLSNFNILAEATSDVKSVSMKLEGAVSHEAVENKLPYALFGDDSGDYKPGGPLPAGDYKLTVTPYSESRLNGEKGQVKTLQFSVVDEQEFEGPAVNSLTLIDADTDKDLLELTSGKVIDPAALQVKNFNIRANASSSTGSVIMVLQERVNYSAIENKLPFAIFGDWSGDYKPGQLPEGNYILTVTPYAERGGSGTKGSARTVSFQVKAGSIDPSALRVLNFTLVDATANQDLKSLEDGSFINRASGDYKDKPFNIRANTSPAQVGSVIFELYKDGAGEVRKQVENKLSYDLFGDVSDWIPEYGGYTLKATPYALGNGRGEAGIPLTIRFEVIHAVPRTMTAEKKAGAMEMQENIMEEDIQPIAFSLYPSPADKELHVQYTGDKQEFLTLSIYNVVGELVYQISADDVLDLRIDLTPYQSGVYVAVMEHGDQRISRKFYIKK